MRSAGACRGCGGLISGGAPLLLPPAALACQLRRLLMRQLVRRRAHPGRIRAAAATRLRRRAQLRLQAARAPRHAHPCGLTARPCARHRRRRASRRARAASLRRAAVGEAAPDALSTSRLWGRCCCCAAARPRRCPRSRTTTSLEATRCSTCRPVRAQSPHPWSLALPWLRRVLTPLLLRSHRDARCRHRLHHVLSALHVLQQRQGVPRPLPLRHTEGRHAHDWQLGGSGAGSCRQRQPEPHRFRLELLARFRP